MSGNAPEYQYNEEYFARNKKARSSWVSKFLLGLAPAPLPTSFKEAIEKCIINDHTRYLPRDSNIVLNAFDPSNQDVVRNWHICLPNNCMFHANLPWSLTHTHFPEGRSLPHDSALHARCSAFEKRCHELEIRSQAEDLSQPPRPIQPPFVPHGPYNVYGYPGNTYAALAPFNPFPGQGGTVGGDSAHNRRQDGT